MDGTGAGSFRFGSSMDLTRPDTVPSARNSTACGWFTMHDSDMSC